MAKKKILFTVELETDASMLTIGVLSDAMSQFKHLVETVFGKAKFAKYLKVTKIDWSQDGK